MVAGPTKVNRSPDQPNLLSSTENKHLLYDYFKMMLDSSKCTEDNDLELRRFRRKVKKKLRMGD
jgi:hypothetical protein